MDDPSNEGPRRPDAGELTLAAARGRLFLSSYALLFLIFAVRFETLWLNCLCGGLAVTGVLDTLWITRRSGKEVVPHSLSIATAEDIGGEVGGYLATYLLPFVAIPSPGIRDLVGYALFLVATCIVYVRSDLVRVNPTLYFFGYRVARVATGTGRIVYIIHRHALCAEDVVSVVNVAGVELMVRHEDADN
jgi:hypothetical protein